MNITHWRRNEIGWARHAICQSHTKGLTNIYFYWSIFFLICLNCNWKSQDLIMLRLYRNVRTRNYTEKCSTVTSICVSSVPFLICSFWKSWICNVNRTNFHDFQAFGETLMNTIFFTPPKLLPKNMKVLLV